MPEHVVRRRFGGQTVMLNLKTGQYHGLNEIGGRLLELISESGDFDGAARTVAEECAVEIERVVADLQRLCDRLSERGLIVFDAP